MCLLYCPQTSVKLEIELGDGGAPRSSTLRSSEHVRQSKESDRLRLAPACATCAALVVIGRITDDLPDVAAVLTALSWTSTATTSANRSLRFPLSRSSWLCCDNYSPASHNIPWH
jgi:hypothetical protein